LRFGAGGLAERDDADFMIALRVDDGDRDAGEQTQSQEALLAVSESVVFKGVGQTFKDAWRINEVEAVSLQIRRTFGF
jgi:hypothetical protein